MRRYVPIGLLAGITLALVSACSTTSETVFQQDLRAEQQNGAQFASWQHMGYSIFRGTPATTTKSDLVAANHEKWWGQPVQVAPIQ